jgi:hypothetical protein
VTAPATRRRDRAIERDECARRATKRRDCLHDAHGVIGLLAAASEDPRRPTAIRACSARTTKFGADLLAVQR